MKIYDMYGTKMDIEQAKTELERILSLKFIARNSSYFGDYYDYKTEFDESYELKNNIDFLDNEILYLEYKEFPVLFYVSRVKKPNEIQKLLSDTKKFEFLDRDELP